MRIKTIIKNKNINGISLNDQQIFDIYNIMELSAKNPSQTETKVSFIEKIRRQNGNSANRSNL